MQHNAIVISLFQTEERYATRYTEMVVGGGTEVLTALGKNGVPGCFC